MPDALPFDIELKHPWCLLLLPLCWLAYKLAARVSSTLTFSSVSLLSDTPVSWRQRLSQLPAVLFALATAALIVALARPRTPERETRISREGIAIMMIVDLSSSMDARDLVETDRRVNRLDVVRELFGEFVLGGDDVETNGRPDDLIGLVTFAGFADSVCPLTLDHGNLVSIANELRIVSPGSMEDGTALGDGLGLAVERLRSSKASSRVAILLTDGVNNSGAISPLKAAELASDYEIKVYAIGAGSNGTAPIPGVDPFGNLQLVRRPVEIDEATLEAVASKTGGKYFRATDRESLAKIYEDINELERTEVSESLYMRYTEHFEPFVVAAVVLIASAALLDQTVFRRMP